MSLLLVVVVVMMWQPSCQVQNHIGLVMQWINEMHKAIDIVNPIQNIY
jgi:hypothetical protein